MPTDTEFRTMAMADGTDAFKAVQGYGGASQAAARPKLFAINSAGFWKATNLAPAVDNVLTFALARSGPLIANSPGSTTLRIPLLANIADLNGFSFDPSNPVSPVFVFQNRGIGSFNVNADSGVTIVWNNFDPSFLPQYHPYVTLSMVALNVWAAG